MCIRRAKRKNKRNYHSLAVRVDLFVKGYIRLASKADELAADKLVHQGIRTSSFQPVNKSGVSHHRLLVHKVL